MPTAHLAGAIQVAEEIRVSLEKYLFDYDGAQFSITMSIGIATVAESSPEDFEDLVKRADIALYEAKNSGRNKVCVFNEEFVRNPE